jgi:hypothetical protein
MSNRPGAAAQEEDYRRKSRLLRGFFHFCEKEELCDRERLGGRLDALPKNHDVCHAVHDFVDSIDQALGGPIAEPVQAEGPAQREPSAGHPLAQFMHTLRTLGLQDYAILCELTLRDEGHPLGDYMMRLLGFHLIANLLANSRVRSSVANLDKMRFTEFLPYGEETSASFKKLYADSLTERVVEPWSSHPWEPVSLPADSPQLTDEGVESAVKDDTTDEAAVEDEAPPAKGQEARAVDLLKSLGFTDDGKELPFLQLGDLLIRDESSPVYAVLSASCDLQFTPESVSLTRLRERDDTVLLLPGALRKLGTAPFPKTRATTGLITWNEDWYSIDWFDRKLLGLPHCFVRTFFEGSGYSHGKRLQMGRALELQQNVLSFVSRIGLDVQPPLPMDLAVSVFGKQANGTFARLGDNILQGGILFHLRDRAQPVLVFRRSAFRELRRRMEHHAQGLAAGASSSAARGLPEKLKAAASVPIEKRVGTKLPVVIPDTNTVGSIRLLDNPNPKKGSTISSIGFRVGRFADAPAPGGKDLVFCLSVELA